MTKRVISIFTICLISCLILFSGCGKKGNVSETTDESTQEETTSSSDGKKEEKSYFSMQTSIAYSSGDTKNWTYGNQRKEFPTNSSCYARIGTTAITTSRLGKGNGDKIEVTYRFTGTENCPVEVSDGKAKKVDTGNPDVMEFIHTVVAAKEKKAKEDIMIFRYSPDSTAQKVELDVIYDDQVAEKYDLHNTVYFEKGLDTENGTH